jgi:hypothetical protein
VEEKMQVGWRRGRKTLAGGESLRAVSKAADFRFIIITTVTITSTITTAIPSSSSFSLI